MSAYHGQNADGSARQHNGNVYYYNFYGVSWEDYQRGQTRLGDDPWRHDQQQLSQLVEGNPPGPTQLQEEPQRHGTERSDRPEQERMQSPQGQHAGYHRSASTEKASDQPVPAGFDSTSTKEIQVLPSGLLVAPDAKGEHTSTMSSGRRSPKPVQRVKKPHQGRSVGQDRGRTSKKALSHSRPDDPSPADQAALDHSFQKALESYDYGPIPELIRRGANVNTPTHDGHPALLTMTIGGHKRAVQDLLSAGADANARDKSGSSCLRYAAAYGDPAIVDSLIAAGADVNASDAQLLTPLHDAGGSGNDIPLALLKAGANVNAVDVRGLTVLDVQASMTRSKSRLEFLASHGAKSAKDLPA